MQGRNQHNLFFPPVFKYLSVEHTLYLNTVYINLLRKLAIARNSSKIIRTVSVVRGSFS